MEAVLADYSDDPKETDAELQPLIKELQEKVKGVCTLYLFLHYHIRDNAYSNKLHVGYD